MKQNPDFFNHILKKKFTRKTFIKVLAAAVGYFALQTNGARLALAKATGQTLKPRKGRKIVTDFDLAVAKGDNPAVLTRKAVEALGGMSRFVKRGDTVVVKPNIGWDRSPEQAATTNPYVVAELVKMSYEAGAKLVKVFDYPCNDARRTYKNSGIQDLAKQAGAMVFYVDDWKFLPSEYPSGSLMKDWPMFRDAVECDSFINVPIAKNHSLAGLTLSMKNLMGVCGDSRGMIHWEIEKKLTEITNFIKPDLNVIDAYRILLRHGPSGGNLADVEVKKTVLASADPVLADAYATTLFGFNPADVTSTVWGAKHGLGNMDLKRARIKEIHV